ncbi:phage tail tube protein [Desulfosporosinus lacus]|uniref:Lambda phage tail tube protein, TTP n=1 Tax=Desulfosporosinus lacus DSM 15449 TaxID=1121420 RepID=A0A1M5WGE2_9FIRM|nr:phage tail tube protein [Desulfosporosinus lacus]SHH86571.1 Lambda phage tail tube protein, TTP [Desulfosporosinus lacus DSM 15449]
MTGAKSTFGTTLTRAGSAIAEITNISSPKLTAGEIDVTSMDSANGYKEYIQGMRDGGDVSVEGNFINSDTNGQVGLVTDFNAGTVQSFVITFPDGTTWTFSAFVKGFELDDAEVEGKMGFKATLKVTGKPVLGITAAPNLTALVVTTGTLIPAFAAGTYEYVAYILTGVASVTITPTCATADSITVDDNVVATGVPSSAIALGAAGSVTTVEVVTTDAGKADTKYTIHLTRA